MKLTKTYSIKWWQGSIFKITMLALGVAVGAYWSDIFLVYFEELILIAAAGTLYLLLIVYKSK
jgi:hypothetical protein